MGKIFDWLRERIKLWTKPATPVLIIGILSDLNRSHTDLVVENALLRQQLIVLNRQVKRPQQPTLIVFLWRFYRTLLRSGNKLYIFCSTGYFVTLQSSQ
jgi:putative transposase